jgi:site-specific recombinase XerD
VRAKRPHRLPVVLACQEVQAVLHPIQGVPRLMAYLLYGAGLVTTTQIYTHVLNRGPAGVRSPVDRMPEA